MLKQPLFSLVSVLGASPKGSAAVGLPTQALAAKELRCWVIPPGTKPWKHTTANPSRADIVGYMPSTAEQAWLTGEAKGHIYNITKQPLVNSGVRLDGVLCFARGLGAGASRTPAPPPSKPPRCLTSSST